jgi:aminoglycoside phosphotransferase (APT) family kinase protein
MMYEKVLRWLPVTTPRFFGYYEDPPTNDSCLLIEYLPGALRLHEVEGVHVWALPRAVDWLAQFHASYTRTFATCANTDLRMLLVDDIRLSAHSAAMSSSDSSVDLLWLRDLAAAFGAVLPAWLAGSSTLLHGEFYPMNILVEEANIYPSDWETAVIGPPEIDLASLTEGWDESVCSECYERYRLQRGFDQSEFNWRLSLAIIFWQFRWLGCKTQWARNAKCLWRYELLHGVGKRIGLI